MILVKIRGGAMPWYYLCDNCQQEIFSADRGERITCIVCQERAKAPKEFLLCNGCSYETKMCMACGEPVEIGDDYEKMMERAMTGKVTKRRKKKQKK